MYLNFQQFVCLRPRHHAMIERPAKNLQKNRYDMERHSSNNPSGRFTVILRPATSICVQIDGTKGISTSRPSACTSINGRPPYCCQPVTLPKIFPVAFSITSQPIRSL